LQISIDNIVFGCPEGPEDDPAGNGALLSLASFYAELLGMRMIREDWPMIATDVGTFPRLAFGDGPSDYLPPRWPDPEHPQQVHLDITVSDLEAAEQLVLRLGASRLQDRGGFRTYADPVGHPFCLYLGNEARAARVERVVFDCFSPRALAAFYRELMTMAAVLEDSPERVVIGREDGGTPMLAFQHVANYLAPRWPDPRYPEQVHLDLFVEDSDEANALAERLGAIRLPEIGGSCPVFADPAGHPFCLCAQGM
jgi:hypothetical protein